MKKISQKALWVKALIRCAFFWILISFVQTHQLALIITRINWFYLSLSLLLSPVMLVISCLKWKLVLDTGQHRVSFLKLIRIYLIGYFFSNLLPSTVGGDVVRSYYSGRIISNQSFAVVAIFIERFSGVLLLLLLVILAPLMRTELYQSPYIYFPALGASCILFVILWVWRVKKPLELPNRLAELFFSVVYKSVSPPGLRRATRLITLLEKTSKTLFLRLDKLHLELGAAIITIKNNTSLSIKIIAITILFYVLTWLNVYAAFLAFDVHPNFVGICALVPVILFVAQIPVTILGNLGFFESVFVLYFLLIGVSGAETLAMGLLLRVKLLITGGVGYLVYLSYSHAQHIGEEFEVSAICTNRAR
jgi:uncharacterized protein (TIRG00374 family)